jgi:hypothetical protein
MGKADWSLDQLERDLANGFAFLGVAERSGDLAPGESAALADGVLRSMNGALQKVSESLEIQAGLQRELTALREELRRARQERDTLESRRDMRLRELEAEVAALRNEREGLRKALADLAVTDDNRPPERLLAQPLVLRSPQGEFLGITDRIGQPMSLADFLLLVERGGPTGRVVGSLWERRDATWCLTLSISGPEGARCLTLDAEPRRTPSNNHVTLLTSLILDGAPAPQEYMLRMFRQLRESLQE